MVHATVVGARGYLGRTLMHWLQQHPEVDQITATSTSSVGTPIASLIPSLHDLPGAFVAPDDSTALDADVVFAATPAGEAAPLLASHESVGVKAFIDLSRDHRHAGLNGEDGWVYGMADLTPVPKGTVRIANPGCYPTASTLALAPALQAGLDVAGPIIVDGKSGVSGAGVSPRADLHFPEMNETTRAYKVLGHDHTSEIAGVTGHFGTPHPVRFTPHLVPQTRGLLSTVYIPCGDVHAENVQAAYEQAYASTPFVHMAAEANTGDVSHSNHARVAVDVDTDTNLIIARAAIDNLVKGGSGTAIQNMNDAMGWPSTLGLAPARTVLVGGL